MKMTFTLGLKITKPNAQHSEAFLECAKLYFVRLVKVADIKHHNSITSLQLSHSNNAQHNEHIHLFYTQDYYN